MNVFINIAGKQCQQCMPVFKLNTSEFMNTSSFLCTHIIVQLRNETKPRLTQNTPPPSITPHLVPDGVPYHHYLSSPLTAHIDSPVFSNTLTLRLPSSTLTESFYGTVVSAVQSSNLIHALQFGSDQISL